MLLRMTEPTESVDFAALVSGAMTTHDVTQSELSRRTGIKVPTLSAWLNRTRRPTDRDMIRAIAERGRIGLTVRELFAAAELPLPAPPDDARERRLVETWRELSEAEQRVLEATADALRKSRLDK